MNDSEIIKGLQRMSNEDPNGFSSDVLDLIKRQQAEIERLNIDLKAMRGAANSWKAEVQRICKKEFDNIEIDIEVVKSTAVREFAKKLKESLSKLEANSPNKTYKKAMQDMLDYYFPKIIDDVAKEMGCDDE